VRSRTAVRRLTGREGGGRQVRSKRAELRSRAGNPIPEPGNKAKGTQPFLFSGFPHRVAGALRPSPPHAVSLRAFGFYADRRWRPRLSCLRPFCVPGCFRWGRGAIRPLPFLLYGGVVMARARPPDLNAVQRRRCCGGDWGW
jgi:hypothetical protein